MSTDPLFRMIDLNPGLYKKVKQLERSRQCRLQLYYLKDFVLSCRFAQQWVSSVLFERLRSGLYPTKTHLCCRLQEEIDKEPSYMLTDPEMYSLHDLVQVKNGELTPRLQELAKDSMSHVTSCQLCQARGFVCELCPSKDIIFPWFVNKVSRCEKCGSCFHLQCFKSGFCPRCARVGARRRSQLEDDF